VYLSHFSNIYFFFREDLNENILDEMNINKALTVHIGFKQAL